MRDIVDSRASALTYLNSVRAYREGEQTKLLVAMLDAMSENYLVRLRDGPIEDVPALRTAAKQIALLRDALANQDAARIALLI